MTDPVTDVAAPGPSLIPPESFVALFNAGALANGYPLRSALDPLLMLAWHNFSTPPPSTFCQGIPAL